MDSLVSVTSGAVLVTGGAGYIGSHTCVELLQAGHEVIVFDNLCNSKASVLERIGQITGRKVQFIEGDVRDAAALERIFAGHSTAAVLHFAGLKAVGESVAHPLAYYDNNVHGSMVLFDAMVRHGVRTLVFSSSATVYGAPAALPIREDFPLGATNPYGRTKIMVEEILRDLAVADPQWRIASLRYFNPVGAHDSGLIGESPSGIPNNLMPYISQVAAGKREFLSVFGDDYPTPDGTGVRDYIHVVDLARGHLAALDHLGKSAGVITVNLGTGEGYSVLDMVRAFERASGKKIPYRIVGRRAGDIAACYADPQLAKALLGWRAEFGLERMCRDTWRWQQWAVAHGLG
ncbi:MAG: UDP-glucose 4-epimerase GalE [Gallionellaceae bacterium]